MRTLRIVYALGPGDAVNSYRRWADGMDVLSETSRTFSGQFFDFCRGGGHRGYAISHFKKAQKLIDGRMIVENRPKRVLGKGARYHLSQALYAASIMSTAVAWRADVLIADSGTTHWALLAPLRLAGIRVVGTLHNVPWPSGYRPTAGFQRMILASEAWFWRRIASAVISVSPECERQVRELAGTVSAMAVQFRAQFNRSDFSSIPPPPTSTTPFRILYAGRIEKSKGILDIVEIAELLEHWCRGRVCFDICGGGVALGELTRLINDRGLSTVLRVLGKLDRPSLLRCYASCHAVIVPTRSDFCEGMPMVCAEAILCSRPVITSRLSNTIDVLPGALLLAEADNPRSYAEAIRALVEDSSNYERLRKGCAALQEQFYDPKTSLAAALETVSSAFIHQMS